MGQGQRKLMLYKKKHVIFTTRLLGCRESDPHLQLRALLGAQPFRPSLEHPPTLGADMGPPTASCSPGAVWGHGDEPSSDGRSLAGKAEPSLPLRGAGPILPGALTRQTGCDSPPRLSGTRSQGAQLFTPQEPATLEGQS